MVLNGFFSKVISPLKRKPSASGDPRLLQAQAAAEAAEARILQQFPEGDLPPEAEAHLAKIDEMKKLTQAALAADEVGDLQSLIATAKAARADAEHAAQTPNDDDPWQAIVQAITMGDAGALRAALAETDVNGRYGENQITPLLQALITPDVALDIFLDLFEAGADATAATPWGGNALSGMASGDFGHWSPAMVQALAQALSDLGASFDATDDEGQCPLHAAVIRENLAVTEAFVAVGADLSAAMADDLEEEALRGGTPLHMAVWQPEMVNALLSWGADPTARNTAGQTPAAFAESWLANDPDPEEVEGLRGSLAILAQARAA